MARSSRAPTRLPTSAQRARRRPSPSCAISYLADAEAGPAADAARSGEEAQHARYRSRPDRAAYQAAARPHGGCRRRPRATSSGSCTRLRRVRPRRKSRPKRHGLARVRGGKGTATRAVGLARRDLHLCGAPGACGRIIRCTASCDLPMAGASGGCRDDEYAALGEALRQGEAQGIWPAAIAVARFLALTGWRSGEALALRWSEVDLARRTATLADTKTGRQRPAAVACRLRRAARPAADGRRASIPGDPRWRGRWSAFRNSGRGSPSSAGAARHHAARAAAYLCQPRRGSRIFRADNRGAGRAQGTYGHVALCACRRCGVARRCRRGGEPHG